MEEVLVIPDCSPQLKPVVGQKFQSLDFAFAFYDVYARAVGFDTRKQGMRKAADGVTTWYSVVCNREGSKRSNDVNARSGFTIKRRRLSKRCGCKASISFKFFSGAVILGYIIQEFKEVHNNYMVESEHQQFMTLNRKLEDVHHKFILDCSKANICPTLTFKMVLDDMAKKKELSDAFTYHYEVNDANQYCMIFTPFTGKDNHGKPVTFAAGLVCNEKTGAFGWLFKYFVECMGVAPKMIVTDQDLGMRSGIQEVLVGTRHRWCMWHIMHKLASKVPGRLLRDEDFKKEFNAYVWSDLLEPDEFEEEWNGVIERYELEDVD
ncbi:protein FAR1-RELATED SEQUENCE 5-like [Salvia hispanica]|uniref:protein FAR1-RELATED SEQUENCE 5-like n=1 Tax=Salvia hispanica TaxID=49212 RepID=UPI002009A3E6|nr:protein FAR1-RELATED SEQUENCE 5-like [Salvia hispanica]